MFNAFPVEILSIIFGTFDPLDTTWPVIMRLSKNIREIATATRRLMPAPISQIVERGEHAIDYYIDLLEGFVPGGAIMLFEPHALDLLPRHFQALMQHTTISFDVFVNIVMHRPDLSLIAWEAQNVNRWVREKMGRLFMEFDAAQLHVESRFQHVDIIMMFRKSEPGLVRCFLFNAVSDGLCGHLALVLLYSAAVGDVNPIIGNEFLSVLMNWAVVRGRTECVAIINEIIRRDDAAELAGPLRLGDKAFPRYDRDWLASDAIEHIVPYSSFIIGPFITKHRYAMLDAEIPSRVRNSVDIHITRIDQHWPN